jgi:hypothetical protein
VRRRRALDEVALGEEAAHAWWMRRWERKLHTCLVEVALGEPAARGWRRCGDDSDEDMRCSDGIGGSHYSRIIPSTVHAAQTKSA